MYGKRNQQAMVLYPRASHTHGLKEQEEGVVSRTQGE